MNTHDFGDRRAIAVVGAGLAGLTAAYVLAQRCDVTLYESDDRLGGDAHTHDVTDPAGNVLAVNTGLIVHNDRTYPHLRRLFGELGVETRPTGMSMSIQDERSGVEFASGQDDLATAERRKIDAILDLASVQPGCEMLEIGAGWGELAIRAAQRGAHVTTVTLSTEQRDLALRRVAAAGVSGRVRILVADYREVAGQYDAIVSVEMVEAVGRRFWRDYFVTLDRLLRPGGRIGLQSITFRADYLGVSQFALVRS